MSRGSSVEPLEAGVNLRFDKIVIIGNGSIACTCLDKVLSLVEKNDVIVFESQYNAVSMLKARCTKNDVSYYCLKNKNETMDKLANVTSNANALIISANNELLFPQVVCEAENLTIINFHYSYLPDYRGMNIPTWVIYNGEEFTGITWHYVNKNVDDGRIIIQKKIPITDTTTAIEIVRKVMSEGCQAFNEFIDKLLGEPIEGTAQVGSNIRTYRRKQLPNDGILDVDSDAETTSRLLRAFDYGPLTLIPRLKLCDEQILGEILKYRIFEENKMLLGQTRWEANYTVKKGSVRFELLVK